MIFAVVKQLIKALGVMLYQLSYEASLEAGQERVQLIPVI